MNEPDVAEELERRIEAARTRRERIDLMLELCLRVRAKDPVRGHQLAIAACELARSAGYSHGAAVAYLRSADCVRLTGDLRRALRYLDRAEPLLRDDPDGGVFLPQLLRTRGTVFFALGRTVDAIESLERALKLFRDLGDGANVATTLAFLGDAYREVGDFPCALLRLEESLRLAEELGQQGGIGLALANISCVYGDFGDTEMGIEYARRAHLIARETGNSYAALNVLRNIAAFHRLRNEHDEARTALAEARDLALLFDAHAVAAACLATIATLDLAEGKRDQALRLIQDAHALEQSSEATIEHGIARMEIGQAYLYAGMVDPAIEWLEKAIAIGEESRSYFVLIDAVECIAAAWEQKGEYATSLRYHLRIRELRRRLEDQQARRTLARIESRRRLKSLEDERARADEHARVLAAEIERRGAELAAISLRLAQREELVNKLRGDVIRYARDTQGSAAELAQMLVDRLQSGASDVVGWSAFEERFAAVQDGFLDRLSQRSPDLTSVERKICAYIHVGLSNKEIAAVTASSVHTINTHRRNIRRKLKLKQGASLEAMLTGHAP